MLYHKELGIPNPIRSQIRQTGRVVLNYSEHAQLAADERGIVLPRVLDYTKCEPFEIETKRDGTIIKVAYRTRYAGVAKCDLVLIVHPQDNFVRTIWLNLIDDQHQTLDVSLYEKAVGV